MGTRLEVTVRPSAGEKAALTAETGPWVGLEEGEDSPPESKADL